MRIFKLTELGAAVRRARNAKGLSQSELAKAIGATQEWISRLENGRLPNPGFANIMQACSVIGLGIFVGSEDFQPDLDVTDKQSGGPALGSPHFLSVHRLKKDTP